MHLILLALYRALTYLLLPLFFLHIFIKGFGNRAYWRRLPERFGHYGLPPRHGVIWVHAVSVGEVQAAAPLVRALLRDYPAIDVLLTTTTPTGSDRVRALFDGQVVHCYAPLDLPHAVKLFLEAFSPRLAIILETEIWPNLFHACGARGIPLALASARVSPQSIGRYRMLTGLFKETLSHGIVIAAQTETDAERFISLGASPERTHVTGNIKFDFELQPDLAQSGLQLRNLHAAERPVWVAASTHANEEEIVLAAHSSLLHSCPDALLILVPRHPERFDTVATLIERQGMEYVRRSDGAVCNPDTRVLLGDTMGELMLFYAAADVAFVGGSLVRVGGHNLLEPAAVQVPILTGPHTYNAPDIAEMLLEHGVATTVQDASGLVTELVTLLQDPEERSRRGAESLQLVNANRGSVDRLLKLLEPLLRPG